jgi:hypothetical protein
MEHIKGELEKENKNEKILLVRSASSSSHFHSFTFSSSEAVTTRAVPGARATAHTPSLDLPNSSSRACARL